MPASPCELLHFISAMQWLCQSFPDFSNIMKPLLSDLERAYDIAGQRTKRTLHKISMADVCWTSSDCATFKHCTPALRDRITIVNCDPTKRLSFNADSRDLAWVGITTKVPIQDINKPHADKSREPLEFLSGHFNSNQLRW